MREVFGSRRKASASRGQLASSLGGKLVDLRRVSLGLYGEAELLRLGLGGAVSQDPVKVYRQGQKALRRIRQPNLELQAPRWMTITIEVDSLVAGLGDDVKALGKSLVEVRKQRRLVEKAASIRRRAEEEFDRNYQLIGSSSESYYRMAGLEDEAERARPSRRRGGQGGEPAEEGEEPVEEAGAEPQAETAAEGDTSDPRPAP